MRKNNDSSSLLDVNAFINDPYPQYRHPSSAAERASKGIKPQAGVATLLVEPNTLLREGLKRILVGTDYGVVASGTSTDEIRRVWMSPDQPHLLILGVPSGHESLVDELHRIKSERPGIRIALLVESYDLQQVVSAFDAGADAYLAKTISHEILLKSLDLVMLGETVFPSMVLDLVRRQTTKAPLEPAGYAPVSCAEREGEPAPKQLSMRETVILRCLMQGDSNKLIARKFDIAEATVKVHVKAILRKIQAKNRTQAAIWAASHLQANQSGVQG